MTMRMPTLRPFGEGCMSGEAIDMPTQWHYEPQRVIKVEADVKHSLAKPKTVDEALAELESRVGKEGRRKFEEFLREVAEDEDVIDVEFEIRRALFAVHRHFPAVRRRDLLTMLRGALDRRDAVLVRAQASAS